MSATNQALSKSEYTVVSVEKTDPKVDDGQDWYEYVIGRGNSIMVGSRSGTLKQVTEHANTVAVDLNSRRGLKTPAYGRQGSK